MAEQPHWSPYPSPYPSVSGVPATSDYGLQPQTQHPGAPHLQNPAQLAPGYGQQQHQAWQYQQHQHQHQQHYGHYPHPHAYYPPQPHLPPQPNPPAHPSQHIHPQGYAPAHQPYPPPGVPFPPQNAFPAHPPHPYPHHYPYPPQHLQHPPPTQPGLVQQQPHPPSQHLQPAKPTFPVHASQNTQASHPPHSSQPPQPARPPQPQHSQGLGQLTEGKIFAPLVHNPSCMCAACAHFKALPPQMKQYFINFHRRQEAARLAGLPPPSLQTSIGQAADASAARRPQPPMKAADLLRRPGRARRPARIVVILRGLPGAGKSRTARTIRDIEVACGGEAPRVMSIDDYFLVEKQVTRRDEETGSDVKVSDMEYEWDAAAEDAYKASALKAFRSTIDKGMYRFLIIDAPNARAADFEEYWSHAKYKGYEVYVMHVQASVAECAARTTHGRTRDDIALMHQEWEDTPLHMCQLTDLDACLRTDKMGADDVEEVEMGFEEDDDTQESGEGAPPAGASAADLAAHIAQMYALASAPPPEPSAGDGGGDAVGSGADIGASSSGGSKSKWAADSDSDEDGAGGRVQDRDEQPGGETRGAPRVLKGVLKKGSAIKKRPRFEDDASAAADDDSSRSARETGGGTSAAEDVKAPGLQSLLGDFDEDEDEQEQEENAKAEAGGGLSGLSTYGDGEKEGDDRGDAASGSGAKRVRWKDVETGDIESMSVKRAKLREEASKAHTPQSPWAQKLVEEQRAFAQALSRMHAEEEEDEKSED